MTSSAVRANQFELCNDANPQPNSTQLAHQAHKQFALKAEAAAMQQQQKASSSRGGSLELPGPLSAEDAATMAVRAQGESRCVFVCGERSRAVFSSSDGQRCLGPISSACNPTMNVVNVTNIPCAKIELPCVYYTRYNRVWPQSP